MPCCLETMPDTPNSPTTEAITAIRDHVVLGRFRLRVLDPIEKTPAEKAQSEKGSGEKGSPDKGRTLLSTGARTVIGTDPTADLALNDTTVSRFHCEIRIVGTSLYVRDLGSTNGTVVNGVEVKEAKLEPNAVLRLGRTQVRFEPASDAIKLRLSERESFGNMVGRSVASRRAFALLEQAAASDATVLLHGETGTGKEVAAESIHLESARRDGPFIVVDCGAVPPNLLESELFGHERGAFTGADRAREGAFEAAIGGTIFLDEIGELGTELQPKLLRVLEKREVKRVGSNKVIPLDLRVIAATNRDLRAEVNNKTFRADLYFRLAVLELPLPPLRERVEDLPLLVAHIVRTLGAENRPDAAIARSPAFLDAVVRHQWPGNVRELRNYVERCLALQEEIPFEPPLGDGPESIREVNIGIPIGAARDAVVRVFERAYLEKILNAHDGNVSAAARAAQLDRVHFHRLLRKYGLRGNA